MSSVSLDILISPHPSFVPCSFLKSPGGVSCGPLPGLCQLCPVVSLNTILCPLFPVGCQSPSLDQNAVGIFLARLAQVVVCSSVSRRNNVWWSLCVVSRYLFSHH